MRINAAKVEIDERRHNSWLLNPSIASHLRFECVISQGLSKMM